MTDFATTNDIVAALAAAGNGAEGCRQEFYKASLAAVGGWDYSGWMMVGAPAAGVAPTTWENPGITKVGCWCPKLINGGTKTNRLLLAEVSMINAGQNLRFVDRVGHMGGLSGTSVAAQTVNGTLTAAVSDGRCNASGDDVSWYLEWYAATGATAVTATVAVTYNDDSTGNVSVSIASSTPAYRMLRILPAVAGKTIKAVGTVTLSASTTGAGNFGVSAYKHIASSTVLAMSYTDKQDYAYLGLPKIPTNACITGIFWTSTTSLGVITGALVIGAK